MIKIEYKYLTGMPKCQKQIDLYAKRQAGKRKGELLHAMLSKGLSKTTVCP